VRDLTTILEAIADASAVSKDVDAMNEAAAANGGTQNVNPVQDLGFMYNRSLADPDGHVWEAMWMDPAAIPSDASLRLEYLDVVDPVELQPVDTIAGTVLVAGALWVGHTRLIDNVTYTP